MKKYLLFISFLIYIVTCTAQSWPDTVALIEKTMSRYQPANPGYQLSISRGGKIIYSQCRGMADLEHNIPLSLTSVTEAGSVSKQFTAAAILLLEQQGKLLLTDDVRKYIPELPDYGTPVKLEQMMHHTSGIRDWGSVVALSGWPRSEKTYNNDDALEIISQQKALNNLPGSEYIYSNSNYNLLAIIVQRVSGLSLAAFTARYIFEPAGMTHTSWRDDHKRIVSNRAIAYAFAAGGYKTDMPNEDVYGNGGLLTTTEDLLKWNHYYLTGRLGSPSLLPRQLAVVPFKNGLTNNYGAGLLINKIAGADYYITHSGSTASYRANLEYFPSLNLSIAFLSNTSQYDRSGANIAIAIRNIFVKDNNAVSTKKIIDSVRLAPDDLKPIAGWYRNDRNGNGLQIKWRDSNLVIDGEGRLVPIEKNSFMINDNRLIIMPDGIKFIVTARDSIHYTKVDSATQTAETIDEFTGKYYSTETMSFMVINRKGNSLQIHIKPGWDYPVTATYRDAFNAPELGSNIYFERNKNNKITTMKISNARARNIAFQKVER